jgi:hypothetical protein
LNFGLISLLASFSKIFKKVIYLRLHQHIQHNNILANEQYGCTHNPLTERASYKLLDNILSGLNNKLLVGGIFCNLKKAFDCVSYNINSLLHKLKERRQPHKTQ